MDLDVGSKYGCNHTILGQQQKVKAASTLVCSSEVDWSRHEKNQMHFGLLLGCDCTPLYPKCPRLWFIQPYNSIN